MFTMTANPENQKPMANYMRNQFPFLGVKTPERKAQSKVLIKASKEWPIKQVFATIDDLYGRDAREYQYVAIDVADANVRRLAFSDLEKLTRYIQVKSWWDTVDTWRKIYGTYVVRHPEQKQAVFELFYHHPNFWMRRVGILLQLLEKESLDTEILTKAIEADIDTDEFFIQKAIGWALRNYSKTNPEWVRDLLKSHELSKLAVREASKYI